MDRRLVSAVEIRVDRVLGSSPLCEVGLPSVFAATPNGDLVVIGGDLGRAMWHGRSVSSRSHPNSGWYPLAVYETSSLRILHHSTTRWPIKAIACHPTLPLAVVGTGSYDGGYFYQGELILLDLITGRTVSLLAHPREVRRIGWRDSEALDLVLAIPCDDDEGQFGTTSLTCSIRRDDWARATEGMLRMPYGETPVPDEPRTDPAAATAAVEKLCGERGLRRGDRRSVWALESLPGALILAALEGVRLECWSPMSEESVWRLPFDGTGYQIKVSPDNRTALALTQPPYSPHHWLMRLDPSVVAEVGVGEGDIEAIHEPGFPAVIVSRADGRWALRGTDAAAYFSSDPNTATVGLGGYDLINHFFDIRHAPDLLFLQGREDKPWLDKWVVAVDEPDGSVRRLFPLEWDESRGAQLLGVCGAYLAGPSGPALVCAGVVHNGSGPLSGNAFVVRRAYPDGEVQWVFTADDQATALDTDDEFVYVTFNSGELVVLHAEDGSVHVRQELRVNGHKIVPLSLARLSDDLLAIGTSDGRILVCTLAGTAE